MPDEMAYGYGVGSPLGGAMLEGGLIGAAAGIVLGLWAHPVDVRRQDRAHPVWTHAPT